MFVFRLFNHNSLFRIYGVLCTRLFTVPGDEWQLSKLKYKTSIVIFMYCLCLVYICLVEDSEVFFVSEKQQEEMIRTKSIRVADDHHGYLNAPQMFRSE